MECEQPAWIPDSQASRCMLCTKEFGIMKTRHHCRACGNVFCDPCSTNTIQLPQFGLMTPQRVCNNCFAYQTKRLDYHNKYLQVITKGQAVWSYERTRRLESHVQLSKNGKQLVVRIPPKNIQISSIMHVRKGLHPTSIKKSCCFGGDQVDEDRCLHIVYGVGESASFEFLEEQVANFWFEALTKAPDILTPPESTLKNITPGTPKLPSSSSSAGPVASSQASGSSSTQSTYRTGSAILTENDQPTRGEMSAEENERTARRKMMEAQRDAIRRKYRLDSSS